MRITQLFKTPSAQQIAMRDLENAQRDLLTAQANAEHSVKMVEYYQGLITRLSQYVSDGVNQ